MQPFDLSDSCRIAFDFPNNVISKSEAFLSQNLGDCVHKLVDCPSRAIPFRKHFQIVNRYSENLESMEYRIRGGDEPRSLSQLHEYTAGELHREAGVVLER
jgi:hypothetical protein